MESLQDPSCFKQPVPADDSQFDLYTIPIHSSWFSWDDIHETEKTHLKEFFDLSSITRTPKIYKEYRDFIISKYREDPSKRLKFTEVRKSLVGDIGLLHKVFLFLESWGLINFELSPETGEGGGSGEEESQGKWKVRVEEGAPNGVRVVAVPNSLKPVTVPPIELGHDGVEDGFKLPPLASYRDVYNEKKSVICGHCKELCESGHYECTKQDASFIICAKCYKNGHYGENKSLNDFKFVECIPNRGKYSAVWTEGETLLLLESVLKHGNDWNLVVENVKTKSKADCISKLLQLPFGDLMLGSSHGGGRLLENYEYVTTAIQGQVASSEFQSDEKIKTGNECHDFKSEGTPNGNNGNKVLAKRRKVTTSPSHMTSSLMKQVAAISSMVGPVITASAADAAVTALCDEYQCTRDIFDGDDHEDAELGPSPENLKEERTLHADGSQTDEKPSVLERLEASSNGNDIPLTFRLRAATSTALGAAAARAKLLADQEEREIEYLMATIIDKQLKKLQYKLKHFDDLELIMEKEHAQLEHLKESMIEERLDVLRRVFDSGISRWKNLAPVKFQVDNVL